MSEEELQRLYDEAAAQCRALEAQSNDLQNQYNLLEEYIAYLNDRKNEVQCEVYDELFNVGGLLSSFDDVNTGDSSAACSGPLIEDLVSNCLETDHDAKLLARVAIYQESVDALIAQAEARKEEISLESRACELNYADACGNADSYWNQLQCAQTQASSSSQSSGGILSSLRNGINSIIRG